MNRLALALVLTSSLSGAVLAGGREAAPTLPRPPLTPYAELSGAQGAAFDRAFMGWMGSYLETSFGLATSTLYGGINPQVRALAQEVRATHGEARARLRRWGGGQFGVFDMAGPLNNDYDRWFLTALPAQHRQLRQLLRLVPSQTRNPNLRQFAAELLPRLDAEDTRARTLLDLLK